MFGTSSSGPFSMAKWIVISMISFWSSSTFDTISMESSSDSVDGSSSSTLCPKGNNWSSSSLIGMVCVVQHMYQHPSVLKVSTRRDEKEKNEHLFVLSSEVIRLVFLSLLHTRDVTFWQRMSMWSEPHKRQKSQGGKGGFWILWIFRILQILRITMGFYRFWRF